MNKFIKLLFVKFFKLLFFKFYIFIRCLTFLTNKMKTQQINLNLCNIVNLQNNSKNQKLNNPNICKIANLNVNLENPNKKIYFREIIPS